MRALEFITGHVIYNPAYTYKTQMKTTFVHREKCFFDFNPFFHANIWSNKTTDFGNSTDWPFYR